MSDEIDTVSLAAELTIAWLGNPHTRATTEDVGAFLREMNDAVSGLAAGSQEAEPAAEETYEGAVTARKSLANPDYIVSMIDGKQYRALKRHLTTNGLTPDEYRARYGLKSDYPMVAPSYSAARSEMALRIGLGQKGRQAKAAEPAPAAKPGRKPKASTTPDAGSTGE
jgi:predicted transcriptional regulator